MKEVISDVYLLAKLIAGSILIIVIFLFLALHASRMYTWYSEVAEKEKQRIERLKNDDLKLHKINMTIFNVVYDLEDLS